MPGRDEHFSRFSGLAVIKDRATGSTLQPHSELRMGNGLFFKFHFPMDEFIFTQPLMDDQINCKSVIIYRLSIKSC
jgi:hypothetical protein